MSGQLLCQINPFRIYCPLFREVSHKVLSTNNKLLPFFNLMGLVISCATPGVNQIMLVVTVSYAIFFSKGAVNFNDRHSSG